MERPNIPPDSTERMFLSTANYVFTGVFTVEMFVKVRRLPPFVITTDTDTDNSNNRLTLKVVAAGMFYGQDAYFTSGWNIMDGSLVTISIIDLLMSWISASSPRIFGILRVSVLHNSIKYFRTAYIR